MKAYNISKILVVTLVFFTIISSMFLNKYGISNIFNGAHTTAYADTPTSPTFEVVGTKIYKNGQEFVVKGTNMFSNHGISELDKISNCWDFNTIRVPVFLTGSYQQPHPSYDDYGNITDIINAYTAANKVVIFEAHDKIGTYYSGEDLDNLKNYWREMAMRFKNNPYVWFDLQNEPDTNNPDLNLWQSYHQDLIKIIRDEQLADNIILVEGTSWGQDGSDWNLDTNNDPTKSAIISRGQNLINFNNKTYSNIVFSMHIYEMWNGSESRLLDYFTQVKNKNLPLIIGEYGSKNNESSLIATQNMFNILAKSGFGGIGRIVWIWAGGDENDLVQRTGWGTWLPNNETNMANGHGHGNLIDSCTNPTNLTALGNLVWQDLRSSSTSTSSPSSSSSSSSPISEVIIPTLAIKINLQGSYNSTTGLMRNDLKTKNLIPVNQPYSTLGYNGTEVASNIPNDTVDWVLVQFRNSAGGIISQKAALLKTNGLIVEADGSNLAGISVSTGTNQVIIRHRNHLAIATELINISSSLTSLDFTGNAGVKGSNQSLLKSGVYGMKRGNINGNNIINSLDRSMIRSMPDNNNIYLNGDINMDGLVNAGDRILSRSTKDGIEMI